MRGQNRFEESIIPPFPIKVPGCQRTDWPRSGETEKPPLKGGLREAVGGRLMESLSKRQSHKCKSSIHHPIRRLRRHLPYLGKVDHQAAFDRQFPSFPPGEPFPYRLGTHMRLTAKPYPCQMRKSVSKCSPSGELREAVRGQNRFEESIIMSDSFRDQKIRNLERISFFNDLALIGTRETGGRKNYEARHFSFLPPLTPPAPAPPMGEPDQSMTFGRRRSSSCTIRTRHT